MPSKLVCYAEGHEGSWEAFCLDLDIAVQGCGFEEVYGALRYAIGDYVEAARKEIASERKRLLNRKAPWSDRVRFFWRYLTAPGKDGDGNLKHGFTMPFPA